MIFIYAIIHLWVEVYSLIKLYCIVLKDSPVIIQVTESAACFTGCLYDSYLYISGFACDISHFST